MRKETNLIVSLVIGLSLVLGGVPYAEAAGKSLVFKFACMFPESHPRAKAWKEYSDKVQKASDGQIVFNLYYAESLVKTMQEYEAVKAGAIDISASPLAYIGGYQNWARYEGMPCYCKDLIEAGEIVKKAFPIFERELAKDGVKLLWAHAANFSNFNSNRGFVKTIDDFKGTKCRVGSGLMVDAYKAWGGAAVSLPSPEMYTALQRGVVDSTYVGPDSFVSYKLWEVAPYVTTFEHPMGVHAIKMNTNSWNKIPEEQQRKIMDIGREMMHSIHPKLEKIYKDLYEVMRSHGVKFHEPSRELRADMNNVLKPVWKRYIELAGNPGREIYKIIFPGQAVPEP